MLTVKNKTNCSGCHACAVSCPKKCITMERDEEGFLYPIVDTGSCIECGLCEKSCPILHPVTNKKTEQDITAYAAINKDDIIREESSSGGIFSLIAAYVIEQGGVVFGAAFDENFNVEHKYAETSDEVAAFRGSKYVQSRIGDSYVKAESFLKEGRLVLFTGTPCQIGGLMAYLKKDYANLITQDIICHGVPSQTVWERYVQHREATAKSDTQKISFRNKQSGWKTYSVLFDFSNSTRYEEKFSQDLYMKAFLSDLCLRPSCYQCSFKGKVRASDFTLADFWGIQDIMPEMDDDKGTSLIFVNSEKGNAIFECIKQYIGYKEVDADKVIKYNPSMIRSVAIPAGREQFLKDIKNGKDIDRTVKKYCSTGFLKRVVKKVYRIIFKNR